MAELVHADRRADLTRERERLVGQLRELGVSVGDDAGDLPYDEGFADSAQVTAERAERDALVATLRESLADVNHALAKFDSGTYGLCEVCNEPISEARLEAIPTARTCIKHAS